MIKFNKSKSTCFYVINQIFAILIISANTQAAVTPAPAPYPCMSIGYSL